MCIQGNYSNDEEGATLTWSRFYYLHTAFCITIFISGEALFFWNTPLGALREAGDFTKYVHVMFYAVLRIRLLLNIYVLLARSNLFLDFFKQSLRYEKLVSFRPPRRGKYTLTRFVLRCVLLVAFIGNVCIGTYVCFGFLNRHEYRSLVTLLFKAFFLLSCFLFYVYDMVHFLVLRPCLEVLVLYIRHQHRSLRHILQRSFDTPSAVRIRKLQQITINLWIIQGLRNALNNIWQYAIWITISTAIAGMCTTIYTAFDKEVHPPERVLVTIYAVSVAGDIVDISALSHGLVEEMRNIKQTLYKAVIIPGDEDYFYQIICLHQVSDPRDKPLSGFGFFFMDLPLVVSLTGSIITYSVILLQTKESITRTGAH